MVSFVSGNHKMQATLSSLASTLTWTICVRRLADEGSCTSIDTHCAGPPCVFHPISIGQIMGPSGGTLFHFVGRSLMGPWYGTLAGSVIGMCVSFRCDYIRGAVVE